MIKKALEPSSLFFFLATFWNGFMMPKSNLEERTNSISSSSSITLWRIERHAMPCRGVNFYIRFYVCLLLDNFQWIFAAFKYSDKSQQRINAHSFSSIPFHSRCENRSHKQLHIQIKLITLHTLWL